MNMLILRSFWMYSLMGTETTLLPPAGNFKNRTAEIIWY